MAMACHRHNPFPLDATQRRRVFGRVKPGDDAGAGDERGCRPAVMVFHQLADEFRIAADVSFFEGDAARRKKLFRHNAGVSTGLGVEEDLGHTRLSLFIRKGIYRVKSGRAVCRKESSSHRAGNGQCNGPQNPSLGDDYGQRRGSLLQNGDQGKRGS